MGNRNSKSAPAEPIDNNKLYQAGSIIGIIIGLLFLIGVIIATYKYSPPSEIIIQTLKGATEKVSSTKSGILTELPWKYIIPGFLSLMCAYYFIYAMSYKNTKGQYRTDPTSVSQVESIQQSTISTILGTSASAAGTPSNGNSICSTLTASPIPVPFNLITTNANSAIGDARTLLNFRPLTVRLPGYINGPNGSTDGVFSPTFGINAALTLGARGFFFDIDYEDARPCVPAIIFRDNFGIKRSLNNGNIKMAITELASKAFTTNYDPVMIIIYLRRIPPGPKQQSKFFGAIAAALNPLSQYHLGQTDKGNFHNCRSESILFTSRITDYQKKFIVITNYDTSRLPARSNPKDNLDYWTNARIYEDPSGKSTALGSVTVAAPSAPPATALVGHISQLLNIGKKDEGTYQTQASGKFCIAIGSPDFAYTPTQVSKLMNTLGIQCVPLDVISLGINANHTDTIKYSQTPETNFVSLTKLTNMYNLTNEKDILSFWTYTGWSMKMINSGTAGNQGFQDYKEGFEEAAPVPPATPIPGFIIPKPIAPKKPSPKMNSNGGLVTIS